MVARAFQNQPRRVVCHWALKTHADLLARAQVSARQCIGVFQIFRCAVKHYLPALLTGARAHINHAVCSQHHGGVMLDHHQRVACIAQAVHGLCDAVHVAWVQADRGFVEHEQGVNQ